MLLMQHPASSAFARNSDESFAIRRATGRPRDRPAAVGRVADSKAGAPHPLRHLGFLLMPARARTESLVERPDLPQRRARKAMFAPSTPSHLDNFVAVVGDRQIEVHRHRADFFFGIFGRQDAPLHRGELAMRVEEMPRPRRDSRARRSGRRREKPGFRPSPRRLRDSEFGISRRAVRADADAAARSSIASCSGAGVPFSAMIISRAPVASCGARLCSSRRSDAGRVVRRNDDGRLHDCCRRLAPPASCEIASGCSHPSAGSRWS